MATSICFYFQVHQPFRMRHYPMFDVGYHKGYFDEVKNREICRKVADKCYLPANAMLLKLIKQFPGQFKVAFSISGVALEQFARYTPEVIASFQALVATGQVELISETYYHSLAALFSASEFKEQVLAHRALLAKHFNGYTPRVFRNTELIYSNHIAWLASELGYEAIITEGVDRHLGWRSPNFVYKAVGSPIKLLLKNYQLSDDIAFRFSSRDWPGYPLTSPTFGRWLHQLAGAAETVNLFMDYETIGEHQWEETGIFKFFEGLPEAVLSHPDFDFAMPSEVIDRYPARDSFDVSGNAISWADSERDTSAWLGNAMQDSTIAWLYQLESEVLATQDAGLIHEWRQLQTSDHFYYMCTKHWSDGDVHKYFSVYKTPHEAYVIMNNVLSDLELRLLPYKKAESEVVTTTVSTEPSTPRPRATRVAKSETVSEVAAPKPKKVVVKKAAPRTIPVE